MATGSKLGALRVISGGVALVACLLASTAAAQTVGTTYEQLEERLRTDPKVKIETVDGRTILGQVRSLSRSGIVFTTGIGQTIPIEEIRTVSQRIGPRPVLRGLLIGLASGAAAGVVFWVEQGPRREACRSFCDLEAFGEGVYALAFVAGGGAAGTVVGITSPRQMKVIYKAPSPPRVAVAPLIAREKWGLSFRVTF